VDAYGLAGADRGLVVDAVLGNHDWCYDVVREGAEAGNEGFTVYWSAAVERAARTRRWYLRNGPLLHGALG
jgi:hypothetical protein